MERYRKLLMVMWKLFYNALQSHVSVQLKKGIWGWVV